MKNSTKVLAGVATVLVIGAGGTATYFGVKNHQLQAEHDKYVQETDLRISELEQQNYDLLLKLSEYVDIDIPVRFPDDPPITIDGPEDDSNDDTNSEVDDNSSDTDIDDSSGADYELPLFSEE